MTEIVWEVGMSKLWEVMYHDFTSTCISKIIKVFACNMCSL